MKKINPKITALIMLILTLLFSGGVAVQEGIGGFDDGIDGGEPLP
jgi:hypothetical protein